MKHTKDQLFVAMLAACLTGFVICPFFYIAIGALAQFSIVFSLLFLPPFLLGSAFLLWRFFTKVDAKKAGILFRVLGGLSWIGVLTFLFFISSFTLLTKFERLGLFGCDLN